MNVPAVRRNDLRAGVLPTQECNSFPLAHSGRRTHIVGIAARMRTVPCLGQTLRDKSVLVRLSAEAAGWREAVALEACKRVEIGISETRPTRAASDLPSVSDLRPDGQGRTHPLHCSAAFPESRPSSRRTCPAVY